MTSCALATRPLYNLAIIAAAVFASSCGDSPTAPSRASTFLSFVSPQGDYIGKGQTRRFTPETGSFTAVHLCGANHLHVTYTGFDGGLFSLDLAAPVGQSLSPGSYENAARWPFQARTQPGLALAVDASGCNRIAGRFAISEATYDDSGVIQRLRATFEQRCEETGPPLTGEVRLAAPPVYGLQRTCS